MRDLAFALVGFAGAFGVVAVPIVIYALRLRVERDAARDLLKREVDAVVAGIAEHLAREAEKQRGQA